MINKNYESKSRIIVDNKILAEMSRSEEDLIPKTYEGYAEKKQKKYS